MAITLPGRGGQILDNGMWGAASNWGGIPVPGVPGAYTNATTVPGDLGGNAGQYGFQYVAPLAQSFLGVPYNQGDTSGHLVNGGYNNLEDQIQDSLRMPSRYSQGWPWNNGAGRYAFATGQAYSPTAGRQAPWDLHPSQPPAVLPGGSAGGGVPGGGIPGGGGATGGGVPGGGGFTVPPIWQPGQQPPTPGGLIDLEANHPFPVTQLPNPPALSPWTFPQGQPRMPGAQAAPPSVVNNAAPLSPGYGSSSTHPLGSSSTNNQNVASAPSIGNTYDEYTAAFNQWYAGLPTSERIMWSHVGGSPQPMSESNWQLQRAAELAHPW